MDIEKLRLLKRLRDEREIQERRDRLLTERWLPTQRKAIDALARPEISHVIFVGPNQVGKSYLLARHMLLFGMGYDPSTLKEMVRRPPFQIAVLLRDYDNHANKLLRQNILYTPATAVSPATGFLSKDEVAVQKTTTKAPRTITIKSCGTVMHIFTGDQDRDRLEGGTWDALYQDEPCAYEDFVALQRGLQKTRGHILQTMTPLSEPWIHDEIYQRAANHGGDKEHIFAVTAWPDENRKSEGGFLDDKGVDEFRANLTVEEREARAFGRWKHLVGRVYKQFDTNVHVLSEHPHDPEDCPHGVAVDPHDRLPFAILWWYLTPGNDYVFYDEWPHDDIESYQGPELDLQDYIEMLHSAHPCRWRVIDPNYGNRRSIVNGLTIAQSFTLGGLPFIQNVNDNLTEGHKRVNELLRYDPEKPIGPLNQPKLYVMENCTNLIKAFRNYVWDDWRGRNADGRSKKEKPREKYKHFADAMRYACMLRIRYQQPGEVHGGMIERIRTRYGARGGGTPAPSAHSARMRQILKKLYVGEDV